MKEVNVGFRIGIVCYPSYGGSGVVATELGKHLAKRGHDVHFISYDLPFRLRNDSRNVYFHAVDLPTYPLFPDQPYLLSLTNKIVEVTRYHQLELLHVHYAIPHATAAYLARQVMGGHSPKIVTTLHGTDITLVGGSPSFFDVTAFSIEQSDGVTAVSRNLAEQTKEQFSIRKPVATIHNFVDIQRFAPAFSTRTNIDEKVLIHISNFRPVKRAIWAVRVFLQLSERLPLRLVLVGEGPDIAEARSLVQQHRMQDRVAFMGKHDDVVPLLQNADLMILPSLQESFGLAVLEAMACGVPAVASSVGGLPELIVNGVTGVMVPAHDFDQFCQRTYELLIDDERRKQMGLAARQRAVQHFSADQIVNEYEQFYDEVMRAN